MEITSDISRMSKYHLFITKLKGLTDEYVKMAA